MVWKYFDLRADRKRRIRAAYLGRLERVDISEVDPVIYAKAVELNISAEIRYQEKPWMTKAEAVWDIDEKRQIRVCVDNDDLVSVCFPEYVFTFCFGGPGITHCKSTRVEDGDVDPWDKYHEELSQLPESLRERLAESVRQEDKDKAKEAYKAKCAARVEESRITEEREMCMV